MMSNVAIAKLENIAYPELEAFTKGSACEETTECLLRITENAFGPGGYGILTISDIPGYAQARRQLLPLSWRFSKLSAAIRRKYEDPKSLYQIGWSHGIEKLGNGNPDSSKGSYYANINPSSIQGISQYPSYTRTNIWPSEDLPELEFSFMQLGRMIVDIGVKVAGLCDEYLKRKSNVYSRLEDIVKTSPCHKGRLLHYFSADLHVKNNMDWCGLHCDHGALTGLCSAMYLDDEGNEVDSTKDSGGLYVVNSEGKSLKVDIPENLLAFQLGQAAQILSNGMLRATPHYVQYLETLSCSRSTFACFLQPHWSEPLESKSDPYSYGINPAQWKKGYSFGDFSEATVKWFSSNETTSDSN